MAPLVEGRHRYPQVGGEGKPTSPQPHELFIARLNGETAPGPIILPVKLRGRASTGDA
ncbi:hypothetical protein GCM10023075_67500 [Streptosporangium album]